MREVLRPSTSTLGETAPRLLADSLLTGTYLLFSPAPMASAGVLHGSHTCADGFHGVVAYQSTLKTLLDIRGGFVDQVIYLTKGGTRFHDCDHA